MNLGTEGREEDTYSQVANTDCVLSGPPTHTPARQHWTRQAYGSLPMPADTRSTLTEGLSPGVSSNRPFVHDKENQVQRRLEKRNHVLQHVLLK